MFYIYRLFSPLEYKLGAKTLSFHFKIEWIYFLSFFPSLCYNQNLTSVTTHLPPNSLIHELSSGILLITSDKPLFQCHLGMSPFIPHSSHLCTLWQFPGPHFFFLDDYNFWLTVFSVPLLPDLMIILIAVLSFVFQLLSLGIHRYGLMLQSSLGLVLPLS